MRFVSIILVLAWACGCGDEDNQDKHFDGAADATAIDVSESIEEVDIGPDGDAPDDQSSDGSDATEGTDDSDVSTDTDGPDEQSAETTDNPDIAEAVTEVTEGVANCDDPTLKTWTRSDYVSSGMPDSYFFEVVPGSSFCATITATPLNVNNGSSAGIYCQGGNSCSQIVREGDTTLIVTAYTDGHEGRSYPYYTLTVKYVGTALD